MADATVTPDAVASTTTLPSPDVVLSYNAVNLMAGSGIFAYNIPGVALVTSSVEVSFGADVMYYIPIRVAEPINVTKLGIYVATAGGAGTEVVFGIYSADIDLNPNGASFTTVTLAIDATGAVDSGAIDVDLGRGTYLVSLQAEDAVQLRCITGTIPDAVGFDATFEEIAAKLYVTRTFDGTNPNPGPDFTAGSGEGGGFRYPFGLEYTIL